MNEELITKLRSVSRKLYDVLVTELKDLSTTLLFYLPTRDDFGNNLKAIKEVILSSFPDEDQKFIHIVQSHKGEHTSNETINEARTYFKNVITRRVNRILHIIEVDAYGPRPMPDKLSSVLVKRPCNDDVSDESHRSMAIERQVDVLNSKMTAVIVDDNTNDNQRQIEQEEMNVVDDDRTVQTFETIHVPSDKIGREIVKFDHDDSDDDNAEVESGDDESITEASVVIKKVFKLKQRVTSESDVSYFSTHHETTSLLIPYLKKYHNGARIYDPCDGNGEMSDVISSHGFIVSVADLHTKAEKVNFLNNVQSELNYDIRNHPSMIFLYVLESTR